MCEATDSPLQGQFAIVTGGGRGIGRAVATTLAARGADIALLGRTADALEDAAREIADAHGADVRTRAVDVTDDAATTQAFRELIAEAGAPAILVNNAGGAESAPFGRISRAAWDASLALNLTSVFTCTQAVLPAMLEAGYGRIVNIASTAGLTGYRYVAAYCAAKHGVVGMTRSLALEVAAKGITVNAICPGFTDTDMLRESIRNIAEKTGRAEAEARDELAAANPQGRLVRPEEVADTVAWLCGGNAGAINGQSVPVDGGEVM